MSDEEKIRVKMKSDMRYLGIDILKMQIGVCQKKYCVNMNA